jgi:hypothetical protein
MGKVETAVQRKYAQQQRSAYIIRRNEEENTITGQAETEEGR